MLVFHHVVPTQHTTCHQLKSTLTHSDSLCMLQAAASCEVTYQHAHIATDFTTCFTCM